MHKKMLIASHECLEVEDYQTNKYGNNSFICSQSPPPHFFVLLWWMRCEEAPDTQKLVSLIVFILKTF